MVEKKRNEESKHLIILWANVMLLATETAMFAAVWRWFYAADFKRRYVPGEDWLLIGMYLFFLALFVRGLNAHRIGYLRITEMWISQMIAAVLTSVVTYGELCIAAGTYVNGLPLIGLDVAEGFLLLGWIYLARVLYLSLYPPQSMLVIYGEIYPGELIEKINLHRDAYHLCRSVGIGLGRERLKKIILEADAVILSDISDEVRNALIKFCYRRGIRVYVTPKISDLILRGAEDVQLFYTPLLLSRNRGLTVEQRFFKRIFDIVTALAGFLLASPLFLAAALAVKLCDGGPVFYRQERLTRDGRPFYVIKFRSMRVDAERDGARMATKGDPRITPVGKFLRRFHLDELPQLLNVLRGEMSMVGPRPERREIAEKYEEQIPEFSCRLKVKAGLTGYAQVNGKYNSTPYDKLKLDITYIEQYSLWLDIKILLWTIRVLFQEEHAEGFSLESEAGEKMK